MKKAKIRIAILVILSLFTYSIFSVGVQTPKDVFAADYQTPVKGLSVEGEESAISYNDYCYAIKEGGDL